MKKNKLKEILSKRGFYVALFSCTAVVVAIAVGLTISNIDNLTKSSQSKAVEEFDFLSIGNSEEETVSVGKSDDKELSKKSNSSSNKVILPPKSNEDITEIPFNLAEEKIAVLDTPNIIAEEATPINDATIVQAKLEEKLPQTEVSISEPVKETKTALETDTTLETDTALETDTTEAVTTFAGFNDDDKMDWPLTGDIVMDYGVERLVYDKTLDQYRTNPSICIAANVGTQVKSAAAGVVSEITESREKGSTVVIDHGNGWKTTYAQLQPNVLVSQGETIAAGDIIGGVANPSLYGILLGGHLDFSVAKDEIPYDPKLILE